jgi:Undecaprenyl-phosphate galactose phosphotransferase WbaP
MAWAERLNKRQADEFMSAGSGTAASVHLLNCPDPSIASDMGPAIGGGGNFVSLLVLADVIGAAASLGTGLLFASWLGSSMAFQTLAPWLGLMMAASFLHAASHHQYTCDQPASAHAACLTGAATAAMIATAIVSLLIANLSALTPAIVVWLAFPLLCLVTRAGARWAFKLAGKDRVPVLLVGEDAGLMSAAAALSAAPHLGFDIAAEIPFGMLARNLSAGGWRKLLGYHGAGRVVLVYDAADPARPQPHMIEALVRERVPVTILHTAHGLPALGCRHGWFTGQDALMVSYGTPRAKPLARMVKTAVDFIVACAMTVVLLPVLLIIAALIKLDGGPALFSHRRIGHGGHRFNCLKFRTMVTNSDAVLRRHLAENPAAAAEWAETRKLRNDPRITAIGRILRKTSLDELPQLFNVLRLDMSLVGPRPIVGEEICRYGDDIGYYYETRPGITGLWQVSGRSDTSYTRRVELDRWYVKNWTLAQDFAILMQTIPAVLLRRGAA